MANQVTDWYSVLGGEVSPYVQKRADMAKFGKWLDNAENIRLDLLGGFMNRPGTVYLAKTQNVGSRKVKLLEFEYSRTDAWIVELGEGYFSVFNKDNGYILDENDNPKRFYSSITLDENQDISYCQIGNHIYIANGAGVRIIKRYSNSDWRMELYSYRDLPPLAAVNSNQSSVLQTSYDTSGFISTNDFIITYNTTSFWHFPTLLELKIYFDNVLVKTFENILLSAVPSAIQTDANIGFGSQYGLSATGTFETYSNQIVITQSNEAQTQISSIRFDVSWHPTSLSAGSNVAYDYQTFYPAQNLYLNKIIGETYSNGGQTFNIEAYYGSGEETIRLDLKKNPLYKININGQAYNYPINEGEPLSTRLNEQGLAISNGGGMTFTPNGSRHYFVSQTSGNVLTPYYPNFNNGQNAQAVADWINSVRLNYSPTGAESMCVGDVNIDAYAVSITATVESDYVVLIKIKTNGFSKVLNPSTLEVYSALVISDIRKGQAASSPSSEKTGTVYERNICTQIQTFSPLTDSTIATKYINDDTVSGFMKVTDIGNTNFFSNKLVGDIFAIYSVCPARGNKVTSIPNNYYKVFEGYTNGKFRLVTSGNWSGTIKISYKDSTTGAASGSSNNYLEFYNTTSSNMTRPNNVNEVFEIDSPDDTVKVLVETNITNATESPSTGIGPLSLTFQAESFNVWSYLRIAKIVDSNTAYVAIVSGDISAAFPDEDVIISTYIWRNGVWGPSKGYPKYVYLVQNRLGFANTRELPQGEWLSRIDSYDDFAEKITYNDDNPVNISALGTKQSEIVGVQAMKDFFTFTSGQEFGIYSETAITQKSKQLIPFSYYGAEPIESQVSGSRLLFVQRGGKNVREMVYSFETANYESNDMTILVQHLLKERRIVATAKLTQADKEIFFLTDDGILLVFKHLPEQEVYAWTHWRHAKYKITNIASCPDANGDQILYLVCEDSEGEKHHEFINYTRSHFFVDSMRVAESTIDGENDDGTDRYSITTVFPENIEIVCKENYTADNNGRIHKLITDSEGKVYFTSNPGMVAYGFSYTSTLTFISPIVQSQFGNTSALKKSLVKVYYDYHDSNGFLLNVNNNNPQRPNMSVNPNDNLEDYMTKVYSGTGETILECSYDRNNKLTFKQSEPMNMYITNVKAVIDHGGQ